MVGDPDWIAESIADKTLAAVTYGSYINEIHPNLCSAAYMLEYNLGRGIMVGAFLNNNLQLAPIEVNYWDCWLSI